MRFRPLFRRFPNPLGSSQETHPSRRGRKSPITPKKRRRGQAATEAPWRPAHSSSMSHALTMSGLQQGLLSFAGGASTIATYGTIAPTGYASCSYAPAGKPVPPQPARRVRCRAPRILRQDVRCDVSKPGVFWWLPADVLHTLLVCKHRPARGIDACHCWAYLHELSGEHELTRGWPLSGSSQRTTPGARMSSIAPADA